MKSLLLSDDEDLFFRLKSTFCICEIDLLNTSNKRSVYNYLQNYIWDILLMDMDSLTENDVRTISINYQNAPTIAIFRNLDLRKAWFTGTQGIKDIIHVSSITSLEKKIQEIGSKAFAIDLKSLDGEIESSELINNAFCMIQDNFSTFNNTNEVAQELGIEVNKLTREFKRYRLPSVKRLLLIFKCFYAKELLKNQGLTQKVVACQAGFSSTKRMSEAFQKIYGTTPGNFKKGSEQQVNLTFESIIQAHKPGIIDLK